MNRKARWLALATLVAVVGCQENQSAGSAPAAGTSSSNASGTTTTSTNTTSGTSATATTEAPAAASQEVTMPSGLKYTDLVVGTGPEATTGSMVSIQYTGRLTDGTQFDSSVGKAPLTFRIGDGTMIRGWDEGVPGMKVGGKRKLTIPPALGYGARGAGGVIPPNATLVFEVELLGVG